MAAFPARPPSYSAINEPEPRIQTVEQAGNILENDSEVLSQRQMTQMLKLLVKELSGEHTEGSKFIQIDKEAEDFRKSSYSSDKIKNLIEVSQKIETENQALHFQMSELKQTVQQTKKDLKSTEKRAGIPAGQALSVEERDQLDFFLQSPGIGMIFLSVAFAVSGEDVSGTLEKLEQNMGIVQMAEDAAQSFPGAQKVQDTFDSFKKEFSDEIMQVQFEDLENFSKQFEATITKMFQIAALDLEVVMRVVRVQVQTKSNFFRNTVVPSIIQELTDSFHMIPGDTEILKQFKRFFSSGGYERFQSDLQNKVSNKIRSDIDEHLRRSEIDKHLGDQKDIISGKSEAEKPDKECMECLECLTKEMAKGLLRYRSELWEQILKCIARKPDASALESRNQNSAVEKAEAAKSLLEKEAEAAKSLLEKEKAYEDALKELAQYVTEFFLKPSLGKPEISARVLKRILRCDDFSIEDFIGLFFISFGLDFLGKVLKSQLNDHFKKKLKQKAEKHGRLRLFLDIARGASNSRFWNWWHRNWGIHDDEGKRSSERETKRHTFMHGLKNAISIVLPIFVLVVQFAYLFFIWHELYEIYDGGVCPGYSHGHREDPPVGPDTKIRTLVGFVGAYFVMKNGSKLFKYLKALEGNNLISSSSFIRLLPFASVLFKCPAIQQIEMVMKDCFAELIADSAEIAKRVPNPPAIQQAPPEAPPRASDSATLTGEAKITASVGYGLPSLNPAGQ